MKERPSAGGVVALTAMLLLGCASIVGIGDLTPPDGGHAGSTSGSGSGSNSGSSGSSSGTMSTCEPPGGALCQTDPQCGCAAGEKCDFSASTTPACLVAGAATSGELCDSATDCAAGSTCLVGVCHPFCNVAGSPCPAAAAGPPVGLCIQATDDGIDIAQAEYCLFECTPLPNNCPAGEACVVVQVPLASGTVTTTNCEVPGTGVPGASCAADGNPDCQAESECDISDDSVCAQFCRSASDCIGVGTGTCNLTVDLVVNGVSYGFCE